VIRFPLNPDREASPRPLEHEAAWDTIPSGFFVCPHSASFTPATLPTRTFPDKRLSVPLFRSYRDPLPPEVFTTSWPSDRTTQGDDFSHSLSEQNHDARC
jgi:hypothetical protein